MKITRLFEFDAGHRLPNHHSACKNVHGHRYKLSLTLSGNILEESGTRFEGMVLDFSDVKKIVLEVINTLDHAFLVFSEDTKMLHFLRENDSKYVVFSTIPTVENILRFLFAELRPRFSHTYNTQLYISELTLWETPNCSATLTE